jgi:hypothetical protein
MRKYLIFTAILGIMSTATAIACKGDGHGHKRGGANGLLSFDIIDTNDDNKVSLAEHNAFHSEKFTEMDTDKNSEISLEEMNNFKRSMKEKFKDKQ